MADVLIGILCVGFGIETILRKQDSLTYAYIRRGRLVPPDFILDALHLLVFLLVALVCCMFLWSTRWGRILCPVIVIAGVYAWYHWREHLRHWNRRWYDVLYFSDKGVYVIGWGYIALGIVWIAIGIAGSSR